MCKNNKEILGVKCGWLPIFFIKVSKNVLKPQLKGGCFAFYFQMRWNIERDLYKASELIVVCVNVKG